jgi:hypothetical protein
MEKKDTTNIPHIPTQQIISQIIIFAKTGNNFPSKSINVQTKTLGICLRRDLM